MNEAIRWLRRSSSFQPRRRVDDVPARILSAVPRFGSVASSKMLWLVIAAAQAKFGGRQGRRAAQRGLLSIAASSTVLNRLVEPLLDRRQPSIGLDGVTRAFGPASPSSFPASAAASAAAFATATALEAPTLAAPVAVIAAGATFGSLSAGGRYRRDVVAGAAIGTLVAGATTRIWPLVDLGPAQAPIVPRYATVEPSPTGRGLVVVVNASAGPAAHANDLQTITEALPDTEIVSVEDPTRLPTELAEVAARATVLGVVGGDGSIGAAAAAALETGRPLAVFPGGTLNHFARDVGVDTIDDAIGAVRDGHLIEVDVATIDERVFLNTASFGSYSTFVEHRERHEHRIGKWPAVAVALLEVLWRAEPFPVVINGENLEIWMIFIGNCGYDPPGFAPATRRRLDDGRLDVRIVDATGFGARARLLAAILTGRLAASTVYTRRLTDHLDIESQQPQTILAADGETFTGSGTFTVAKAASRLRTYAPHR